MPDDDKPKATLPSEGGEADEILEGLRAMQHLARALPPKALSTYDPPGPASGVAALLAKNPNPSKFEAEREDRKSDIAKAYEQSERSAEKPVSNSAPETANPMHARDWRLFVYLGIPAALAITVFGVGLGAFVTGSPHWGFGLCAPCTLVLSVMGVYLLNAKPKSLAKPPYPFVALTTIAVITWIFVGWQTWLWLHTPGQATQAQQDEAVKKATAPFGINWPRPITTLAETKRQLSQKPLVSPDGVLSGLQAAKDIDDLTSELSSARGERDRLKQQLHDALTNPHGAAPNFTIGGPDQIGSIFWRPQPQIIILGGGPDAQITGILFQGVSSSVVQMKEAYVVSSLSGHKEPLKANIPYKGVFSVDQVDIPPNAAVDLILEWKPPLSIRDFLDKWGGFNMTVVYDDQKYEKTYSNAYIQGLLQNTRPDAFGPRMTPKDAR